MWKLFLMPILRGHESGNFKGQTKGGRSIIVLSSKNDGFSEKTLLKTE